MAIMPEPYMLTEEEQAELNEVMKKAVVLHEKRRKAARKQGRVDWPLLPYECSWAFEEEWKNKKRFFPGYKYIHREW